MENVVYYARVSTAEDGQIDALQGQINDLERFIASRDDWRLVDKYIDEGKSGTTTHHRRGYQRLFNDLDTDKFDIIVIKDQSRLMRNTLDWYLFLDKLNTNNKKLYLYLDNCFYTTEDKFIAGIKAMMAEEYSRDLSKKIKSSAIRSQRNGVVFGNNSMYGYNQAKGKLTINEEQADIVRLVFNMYANNNGFRLIRNELSSRGITSYTGTDFSLTTLKRMIKNPKYKGVLTSGKTDKNFETKKTIKIPVEEHIIIPGGVPAIVDADLWDRCNKLLKQKVRKYDNKAVGFKPGKRLLTGKIFCGKCGEVFWHNEYRTSKGKELKEVWQCKTYRLYTKSRCHNQTIHREPFLELLTSNVREVISTQQDLEDNLSVVLASLKKHTSRLHESVEDNSKQIDKIKHKQEILLDSMLDGIITKQQYVAKDDKLKNEIKALQDKAKNTDTDTVSRIDDVIKQIKSDGLTVQVIVNLVDKIIVYDDKITVSLITGHNMHL